jgi:ribosomal protein L24
MRKIYMGDKVLVTGGEYAGAIGLICGIDAAANTFSFFVASLGRVIRINGSLLTITSR